MSLNSLFTIVGFRRPPPTATKLALKDIKTPQDAYEHIRKHFETQKNRAYDPKLGCRYLVPETGEMCAVGCMIAPEHYDDRMEGKGIHADNVLKALAASTSLPTDYKLTSFLGAAQAVHDSAFYGLSAAIPKLDDVAREFGLTPITV